MTPEHIKFLYDHKVMYHNFTRSGVIPHLPRMDVEKFLEIAKTFNPQYSTSLWCGECVMEMVDFVYRQAGEVKNPFEEEQGAKLFIEGDEMNPGIVQPQILGKDIKDRQKRKYEKRR